MSQSDAESDLKEKIALAGRILLKQGVLDGFGHVSARHPERSDRFLLPRRRAPGLVTARDVHEFDLQGDLISETEVPVFLERFIHSGIYAARPDVNAVVHSHSSAIVTMSVVTGHPLRAICHTCGFLGTETPNFEIRAVAGEETDLLIKNGELGADLARVLGDANVVLMRGHGSTSVAETVEKAVYRAIYAETNARIQTAASTLGPVTFLTGGEAEAAERTSDIQAERNWAFWVDSLTA